MISHLQTFAHEAFDEDVICHPKKNKCKIFGEYLGLSFAQSNPREALKLSKKPIGNLPLEILNYMSIWTQVNIENGNLSMSGASGDLSKDPSAVQASTNLYSFLHQQPDRNDRRSRTHSQHTTSSCVQHRL